MRTRTQALLVAAAIAAAGAAEAVVSTTDVRDEAYWNSAPAPQDVRAVD